MSVREKVVGHIEWIENIARRFCRDANDAADLVGETICKCLAQSHRFDESKEFKPWVLTIMANTFRNAYNRRKCVQFSGYDMCPNIPCGIRTDDRVVSKEIYATIRRLDRKSVCIRCVMLYISGFNYTEISRMVGIGVGTVKSRMREGRRLLRQALGTHL